MRGLTPNRLAGPQPVAGAIPIPIPPVLLPPPQCPMSAAAAVPAVMAEELEATRQKRRMKEHSEQTEVAVASSESPQSPATPDSKPESPATVAPETLTSIAVGAGTERKWKKHKEEEATPPPSTTAAAASQILEVASVGATARKEWRRGKVVQGQSGQPTLTVDDHPQGGEAAADGGVRASQSVKRSRSGKPKVLSNPEILRMRIIELRKQQPMPQRFVPAMAFPNSSDQDPNYSSSLGAFFDQFCYKPDRRKGHNAPSLPKTPDRPARPPPRDHPSSLSIQLTANKERLMSAASAVPAAMAEELEATLQKRRMKEHNEQMDVAAASSESPRPPATLDSKPEPPAPVAPETLSSTAVAADKEPKMKKHEVAVASPLVEAVLKEEKTKHKRSKHDDAVATPSPSATAAAASQILEVATEVVTARKEWRQGKFEQGQSSQPPLPFDVHSQGGETAADGGVRGSQSVKRSRSGMPKVLSNREILRMRIIELRKQQPMPRGFVPAMANPISSDQDLGAFFDQFFYKPDRRNGHNAPSLRKTPDRPARLPPQDHPSSLSSQLTENKTFMAAKTMTSMAAKTMTATQGFIPAMANPNSIDQDPKYSLPFGAFFDQFCYKPDRRQGLNAPLLPKAPDHPAQLPPRDHPSSLSQLTANKTFMAAKTTASMAAKTTTSIIKQPHSASASGPQDVVKMKEKKQAEKKMSSVKKPRKRPPLLRAAEKWSDKYRRLPLNQLVRPPRSPHKLLQEKYADDPWKVIVICMLLNLTQGKQVRKKLKGFFKLYTDAQTAYTADPGEMEEYLKPLGLKHVKATNIQKFSKAYVGEEWTHITELCGVGKYAADAYAIFCAGRAKEVVPEDHKLVDYWKYVCFELPLIQESQNAQEAAGATRQGTLPPRCSPDVQQITVSC